MPVSEPFVRDLCFVLKRTAHNDQDAYLVLFGQRSGKMVVLARGLEKSTSKLSGSINIGNQLEVELIEGKAGLILRSCQQLAGYTQRFASYEALLTSVYLCELVDDSLEKADADEAIYALLNDCLSSMHDDNIVETRLYFEWNLLDQLGYECSGPEEIMSLIRNVWPVSKHDLKQRSIIDEVFAFLRLTTRRSDLMLSKKARTLLRKMNAYRIRYHAEISVKSTMLLNEATEQFYS